MGKAEMLLTLVLSFSDRGAEGLPHVNLICIQGLQYVVATSGHEYRGGIDIEQVYNGTTPRKCGEDKSYQTNTGGKPKGEG